MLWIIFPSNGLIANRDKVKFNQADLFDRAYQTLQQFFGRYEYKRNDN